MCTQARKAVKDAQEKLQEEVTAHKHTLDALTNHVNTEAQAKQKILKLGEEAKKQQQWFKDQLTSRADLAKQVEQILKYQINGMKLQSEAQAQGQASKINTLKLSLDELRAKTDMGGKRVYIQLHTQRGRFEKQLTAALEKGWAG